MTTPKTGNPPGRPKGSGKVAKVGAAQKFERLKKFQKQTGYDYVVSIVYPTGGKYTVGTIADPTHEAVGSRFGGGNFELHQRTAGNKVLVGEPFYVNVHPQQYAPKFLDPQDPQARFAPGLHPGMQGGFGFLGGMGQGMQMHPGMQGGSGKDTADAVREAVDEVSERFEDEMEALKEKGELDRRDNERREHERKLAELEAKINAPKSGGMDDILKIVEVAKALQPPPQARMDLGQIVTTGLTALTGILAFGKQVVEAKATNPVDAGDEALKMLMGVLGNVAARVTPAAPRLEAPGPQPQPENQQMLMLQTAVKELTEVIGKSFTDPNLTPDLVADWLAAQSGIGWGMVHHFCRNQPPEALVQMVLQSAGELVNTPEKMAGVEGIAQAIKAKFAVNGASVT